MGEGGLHGTFSYFNFELMVRGNKDVMH
jgi:hypothetical protein